MTGEQFQQLLDEMTPGQRDNVEAMITHYQKQYDEAIKFCKGDAKSVIYSFQEHIQEMIDKDIVTIQKKLDKKISCKKGCSFCCNLYVDIAASEADLLADVIKENNLVIDMERLALQATKKNFDEWRTLPAKDRACVFLKDGECSVYERRPMACRKHAVVNDPNLCDTIKNPDTEILFVNLLRGELLANVIYAMNGSGSLTNLLHKTLTLL